MKFIVAITAFFLLLKPIIPVVEYAMNFDYIANVLCENRDKPETHCNGKCHLMKELAKASDAEKQESGQPKKSFSPIELFCDTSSEIRLASTYRILEDKAIRFRDDPVCATFVSKIFHPPASEVVL